VSRLGSIAMTPMEDLEYDPIRDILAGRKRQTLRPRRLIGKREITVRTQRTGIIIEFIRSHSRKRSEYLTDEFARRDGLRDAAALEAGLRRFYGEAPAMLWENEFEVISAPAGAIAQASTAASAQGQMELSPSAAADGASATGDGSAQSAEPGDGPAPSAGAGWGSVDATGGTAHRVTIIGGRQQGVAVILGRARCGAFGGREIILATYARRLEVLEQETGATACESCVRMSGEGGTA